MPPMTFESIDPPEHPTVRAARMIRELHEQNIALIDSGHQFTKDGVCVNEKMKSASLAQMKLCDSIIAGASMLTGRDADIADMLLLETKGEIERLNKELTETFSEKGSLDAEEPMIPEVGDYGHKEET